MRADNKGDEWSGKTMQHVDVRRSLLFTAYARPIDKKTNTNSNQIRNHTRLTISRIDPLIFAQTHNPNGFQKVGEHKAKTIFIEYKQAPRCPLHERNAKITLVESNNNAFCMHFIFNPEMSLFWIHNVCAE